MDKSRYIYDYFNYLYKLERTGIKYDLNNTRLLLKSLGNPHNITKYIHISGTNGKGGTASFLASILMEHGLKTGLFTSPHILKFNERIRVNGRPISNRYIKHFLDKNLDLIKKFNPSFFEVSTALALKYFAEKKVDVAVVETGLGGRLDSTNVINPVLCIVTQIAKDHMDLLGNSLIQICKEKLGIVKKGIDVIVSDNNSKLKNVFISNIDQQRLFFLDDFTEIKINEKSLDGMNYDVKISNKYFQNSYNLMLHSPLPGFYQAINSAAALLAAVNYFKKAGLNLSAQKVKKAVKNIKSNTGYRCRFETFNKDRVNYILDISHNPDGIRTALNNLEDKKTDVIIFGMMSDKDYKSSIKEILSYSDNIIFTRPGYTRAIDPDIMYNYALRIIKGTNQDRIKLHWINNVNESLKLGMKQVSGNGNILIIGSFFLISDAIKALKMQSEFK